MENDKEKKLRDLTPEKDAKGGGIDVSGGVKAGSAEADKPTGTISATSPPLIDPATKPTLSGLNK